MTMLEIPTAIHRADDELPWVDIGDGSLLKVLQIKEREGLWVIRNRFMPGYKVQTHKHTGPVYAFTSTGASAGFRGFTSVIVACAVPMGPNPRDQSARALSIRE